VRKRVKRDQRNQTIKKVINKLNDKKFGCTIQQSTKTKQPLAQGDAVTAV
jgi:hypothetical protein